MCVCAYEQMSLSVSCADLVSVFIDALKLCPGLWTPMSMFATPGAAVQSIPPVLGPGPASQGA